MIETLGDFPCECCCNGPQEYTDKGCNIGYMRCSGCNCTRVRHGAATQILLRVQIAGSPSLTNIERASELARLLGGEDEVRMVRENDAVHYFEMPAQGAVNALEIVKLRRGERRN